MIKRDGRSWWYSCGLHTPYITFNLLLKLYLYACMSHLLATSAILLTTPFSFNVFLHMWYIRVGPESEIPIKNEKKLLFTIFIYLFINMIYKKFTLIQCPVLGNIVLPINMMFIDNSQNVILFNLFILT